MSYPPDHADLGLGRPSSMRPVRATLRGVHRAFFSFHPRSMPPMSRVHYRRELLAWSFLPFMLGCVEGSVMGVIAKNAYEGVVGETALNFAVAVFTGAGAFANITSFAWASLSHGRAKIPFVVSLMFTVALAVLGAGFAAHTPAGLVLLVACCVVARVCWSGVVTLRTTVWRANYPRLARARIAGKLATIQSLVLMAVALGVGKAMNHDADAMRWIYPLAAALGAIGAVIYARMRVRGHRAMVAAETDRPATDRPTLNPVSLWETLRDDAAYRAYMICMFIFGLGNMLIDAPLVIIVKEQFDLTYLPSLIITSVLPFLFMALSVPAWSRLLDRMHTVRFRSIHSWTFVGVSICLVAGSATHSIPLFWLGAILRGIAFGGGVLAWNLGHHDYAPAARASQYMGVHVTLTGIRGFLAPFLGVTLYELLDKVDAGGLVFAVSGIVSGLGALGFVVLARRDHRRRGTHAPDANA